MKAYVILKTGERTVFETVLFDADEVIEYLNKNQCSGFTFEVKTYEVPKENDNFITVPTWPISVPNNGGYRQGICKTWEDCTNPFKDCVNCPLMFSDGGTISSPNSIETHLNTKANVLGDSVTVTYAGDTQNSLHQAVTGGCSNFTTKLGSFSTTKEFEHLGQSVLNDNVKVTYTNDTKTNDY